MNNETPLIARNTEFETKYRVDPSTLTEFKRVMDTLPNLLKFIYVEGPDDYFTNEKLLLQFEKFGKEFLDSSQRKELNKLIEDTIGQFPPFMRYRRPSHGLDNDRKELTTKYKPNGAKNNIQREEKNIRVDETDEPTIKQFIKDIGYSPNFSIWKTCHIYNFNDATLVFYSVYDTTDGRASKMDNFVEIEVNEAMVHTFTEEQAWNIIAKYEKALESLGLSSRSRLRKSLFEMYVRETK